MVRRNYTPGQIINKLREEKYYFKKSQTARGVMKMHRSKVLNYEPGSTAPKTSHHLLDI